MSTYTTSTVMSTVPLEITFTCPHCGNTVSAKKYIKLDGQITVKGYGANADRSSATLAQTQMLQSMDPKIRQKAEQLERGTVILQDEAAPQQVETAAKLTCPHCGLMQVPDAGCKRKKLSRKVFFFAQMGLVVAWMIACFCILGRSPVRPLFLLYASCIYAAAAALLILRRNQLSQRAYADPAFMAQHFHSTLNNAVYADFTPYGLGQVHLGSKK